MRGQRIRRMVRGAGTRRPVAEQVESARAQADPGKWSRRVFLAGAAAVAGALFDVGDERSGSALATSNVVDNFDRAADAGPFPAVRTNPPAPRVYVPTFVPGEVVTRIETDQRIVVFTFDDGPDAVHERALHQVLTERGYAGKAAFFFVGQNARARPDVVREMFDAGYDICNHTLTHSTYAVNGEVREIEPTQNVLRQITGATPVFFRAAGGTMGGSINNECRRLGLTYIWTDGDERDYVAPRIGPDQINAHLRHYLHPGYISLRHSGGSHNNTIAAMHDAISIVEDAGYQIMSLTEAFTYRDLGAGRAQSNEGVSGPGRVDGSDRSDRSDRSDEVDSEGDPSQADGPAGLELESGD